jgi:2-isopropylmalate synthase
VQVELAQAVQAQSERDGGEMDGATIHRLFCERFLAESGPYRQLGYRLASNGHDSIEVRIDSPGGERTLHGEGEGAIAAFADAWARFQGATVRVLDYQEHALGAGTEAEAAAYVRLDLQGGPLAGAGIDRDTVAAALKAVIAALNRAQRRAQRRDEGRAERRADGASPRGPGARSIGAPPERPAAEAA